MSNRRPGCTQRELLADIAHHAMIDRGLEHDFPPDAERQAASISAPAKTEQGVRDLRAKLWCSIDNDDSRDLDQLTVAEGDDKATTVFVAVADVDALIRKGSPIDDHARKNTTSVYTAAKIFPMLPEKLSTGLTSLNEGEDRVALVVEMTLDDTGEVKKGDVYRGLVRN